ncbi:unnamed protein product [Choristocarpus tenellus]
MACRKGRASALRLLFDVCDESCAGVLGMPQVAHLFEISHAMSQTAWGIERSPASRPFDVKRLASSVSRSQAGSRNGPWPKAGTGPGAVGSDNSETEHGVDFAGLKLWVSECAPLLHTCLTTFMHTRCFHYGDSEDNTSESAQGGGRFPLASSIPSTLAVFDPPRPQQPSVLLEELEAELFGLALSHKKLQGPWLRLYTNEEDGLSFNRVCYKIIGFGGPTVILVREKGSGAVWGGCAGSPWKESNSFYGDQDNFLLRLAPDFSVLHSKVSSNGNFQYLNLKGFSLPHGLGMGGTLDNFRFFLPEALDGSCVGRSACLTFESGELCPESSRRFEVDSLEVWGVGGAEALEEALKALAKQREVAAHNIQKARQVDRSKFAENEFDREFLLGKTFGGGGNYNSNQDRRQGQS